MKMEVGISEIKAMHLKLLAGFRSAYNKDSNQSAENLINVLNELVALLSKKNSISKDDMEEAISYAEESYRLSKCHFEETKDSKFLDKLVGILHRLHLFYKIKNSLWEAERFGKELLEASWLLSRTSANHCYRLSRSEINMSLFYQESRPNRKLSIDLLNSAIANLSKATSVKDHSEYLEYIDRIIRTWGIDVEQYLSSNPSFEAIYGYWKRWYYS